MSLPQSDELKDPALVAEVELARAAAQEEAGDEEVGAYVDTQIEGDAAVTHLFEASKPGYYGWRWAVTVSSAGPDTDVTVSEVVLLPGPDALVAPDWVPWEHRVQAGDLGVGDLLPTAPDDDRLVPGYVASDDPAVEAVALEIGLGRPRVMSRPAREDAAARWQDGEYGPRADMARSAPAHCGTCGFYLQLAGSLGSAFGTCGNEYSPADGHIVHAEYGCGAHSEAEVEQVSPVLVANLIYDDALLDVEPLPAPRAPEPEPAEAEPAPEAAAPTEPDDEPVEAEPPVAEPAAPEAAVTSVESAADVEPAVEPAESESPEPTAAPEVTVTPEPETPETAEAPDTGSDPADGHPPATPIDPPPHSEPVAPLEPLVSTETSVPTDDTKSVGWSGWRAWTAKRQEDDATEPEG